MPAEILEISRVGGGIGAEIHGVDLARDLSDRTVAAIRQALLDHLVVFLHGQDLTPTRYRAFATRIGRPIAYPFVPGIEGFPEITPVLKRPEQTINFGGVWHSDTTYLPEPPMATMLLARELPAFGGDTEFSNQYLDFESLSDGNVDASGETSRRTPERRPWHVADCPLPRVVLTIRAPPGTPGSDTMNRQSIRPASADVIHR